MIIKWLQGMVGIKKAPENLDRPHPVISPELIDIAHEVLAKEALEKQLALKDLEKYGWPFVQRQHFRKKIQAKVKKFLSIPLTNAEEDFVEEVTEKITETAEADPYYKRLFDGPEEKI